MADVEKLPEGIYPLYSSVFKTLMSSSDSVPKPELKKLHQVKAVGWEMTISCEKTSACPAHMNPR